MDLFSDWIGTGAVTSSNRRLSDYIIELQVCPSEQHSIITKVWHCCSESSKKDLKMEDFEGFLETTF